MFWCKCAFCQREASFFQIRTKTNLWPIRSFCRIALYLSLPVHLSQSPCKFVKYIPRYRKILARNCLFHRLQYKIRRQSNGKKNQRHFVKKNGSGSKFIMKLELISVNTCKLLYSVQQKKCYVTVHSLVWQLFQNETARLDKREIIG